MSMRRSFSCHWSCLRLMANSLLSCLSFLWRPLSVPGSLGGVFGDAGPRPGVMGPAIALAIEDCICLSDLGDTLSLIRRLSAVGLVVVFRDFTSSDAFARWFDLPEERVVLTSGVTSLDSPGGSPRPPCCSFAFARIQMFDTAPRRDSGGKWTSATLCRSGHKRLSSGAKLGAV